MKDYKECGISEEVRMFVCSLIRFVYIDDDVKDEYKKFLVDVLYRFLKIGEE